MATVAKSTRVTTITLGSSSAGPFDIGFRVFDDDGVDVYINGVATTDFTLSTDYSDGFDDAATITLDSAADTDDVIRIESDLVPDREADYATNEPTLTAKLNIELARQWAAIADLHREVKRSARVLGNGFDPLAIPLDEKFLTLNTSGQIATGPTATDIANASTYATQAAASATAAQAAQTAAEAAENSLLEWTGAWLTATAYAPSDLVQESGNTYVCVEAHTSGTFSTDLGAGKWEIFAAKGATGAGSGDLLAVNNLTDVDDIDISRNTLQALYARPTAYAGDLNSLTVTGLYRLDDGVSSGWNGANANDFVLHFYSDADNWVQMGIAENGSIIVRRRLVGSTGGWFDYVSVNNGVTTGNDIDTFFNLIAYGRVSDGSSAGFTVAASDGCTITRLGNGQYQVVFDTERGSVDYMPFVQTVHGSSYLTCDIRAQTTTGFQIRTGNVNSANTNSAFNLLVFVPS